MTKQSAATIGRAFARALAAKDATALRGLLAPAVDFRAMTPGRFWEAADADTVIEEVLLGKWFEPTDEIRELISLDTDAVGHRHRVGYRLRVENADGQHLVDQQAYYEPNEDGDKIAWLRIMCAGFVHVDA